ncbi:MAG: hypothetical protein K6G01_08765 [Eubacterium sp.]|nr:hypothetical protein [Eubacterium sp.]
MKKEREEYLQIIRDLQGDAKGKKLAKDYIDHSDGHCYGIMAPISFVPTFYTKKDLAFFEKVCTMTHNVLSKVIKHYIDNPKYRTLFCFSKEVEEMILLPCGYDEMLPMSRFDFFLSEDDFSFKFCEFNADGTAAMSRTNLGCEAVMLSDSYKEFAKRHKISRFDIFDSWVEEMMKTYRSDKNAIDNPNVLITDFEDAVTKSDITRFLEAFKKKGYNVRFVDTRKLAFDGEHLIDPSDGTPFHVVYRRLVTSDIVANKDKCKAFIDAVAQEKVCIIGHFRTTVTHSKMINVALLDEMTKAIMTQEEWDFIQEHVLPTYRLRNDQKNLDITVVKNNPAGWILKPEDDYDAKGVYAGINYTQEEWAKIVDENIDNDYVAMEFYNPPLAKIFPIRPLPYEPDLMEPEEWHSMTGIYSYNGTFYGFFSRMGKEGVISESHDGVSIPSFGVDLN